MTNLFIGFFSLFLVIWYLSGFLPKRRITRKINRFHAWGVGDQIWGWIDGDKKWIPDSMPFPFKRIYFPFSYSQYTTQKEIERVRKLEENNTPLLSKDGKPIRYSAPEKVPGTDKFIWIVTEEITRIRKKEIHPYLIQMNFPISGLVFYGEFTAKLKVDKPEKMVTLDNPLFALGTELNDAVGPWGAEKESVWMKEWKEKTDISEKDKNDPEKQKLYIITMMNMLRIDEETITIGGVKLKEYLNTNKKSKDDYGFEINEFSFQIRFSEAVTKILNLKNETLIQEKENQIRTIKREREKLDEEQRILLDKKRNEDVNIPLLQKAKEIEEARFKGFTGTGTLFAGNQSESIKTEAILATVLSKKAPEPDTKAVTKT